MRIMPFSAGNHLVYPRRRNSIGKNLRFYLRNRIIIEEEVEGKKGGRRKKERKKRVTTQLVLS